jgi:hypothetical protein
MPNDLFDILARVRADLPSLLRGGKWSSLYVDYHAPFVERVWCPWGDGYRVYLHRILPCTRDEALFHPHAGPSVMQVLSGIYGMDVGYGAGDTPPPVACSLTLTEGSVYSMPHPDGWHSVYPFGEATMSLMVSGPPWGRTSPKPTKALRTLDPDEVLRIFDYFARRFPAE